MYPSKNDRWVSKAAQHSPVEALLECSHEECSHVPNVSVKTVPRPIPNDRHCVEGIHAIYLLFLNNSVFLITRFFLNSKITLKGETVNKENS